MKTDIYITAIDGTDEIQIPWLPEKIDFSANDKIMATYSILDSGEVKIPSGRNLRSFSWSSIFPGEAHSDLPFLRTEWQNPKTYQGILSRWLQKGTPLRLLITGTPINHDVYLESYSVEYAGGYGDYAYSVSFVEKRDIIIGTTKTAGATNSANSTASATPTSTTYTIKSGDTLWSIAQKCLGSGAKYSTLYSLNQTIIEETAKKNGKSSSEGGKWIYAGTVIKLPTGATASSGSGSGSSTSASSYSVNITSSGNMAYVGEVKILHIFNGKATTTTSKVGKVAAMCDANTEVKVAIYPASGHSFTATDLSGAWVKQGTSLYVISSIKANSSLNVKWSINKA